MTFCTLPERLLSTLVTWTMTEMRDMRTIVVHEYFGLDLNIVWQTFQEDLPVLIEQIEEILESDPEGRS